ncbi:hypothetical protein L1887_21122 [Cichorium endivia]|nr:hypothetical protein L1887_21122 [Cichorium endivia]
MIDSSGISVCSIVHGKYTTDQRNNSNCQKYMIVFCFCVSISRRSTASLSLSVEVLKTSTARIVPPRITPNLSRDFPCPPKEVDAEYRVLSKDFPIMKTYVDDRPQALLVKSKKK